jgi:crotonobetainyl-CoA:carnitine CoA-transferase CaiB-like acyl-CoA transferase
MTAAGGPAGAARPLPLTGITVLDLGHIYQGPYAGLLLALAGARVVKVEPPDGEGLRGRGGSLPFAMLNGNKESISLDLKHPDGLAAFHRLAANVDVVVMNFAPGVPERLGIGPHRLLDVNPRLIVAHASGFGVRGLDGEPLASTTPAMDLTIQAHAGPMGITGFEDEAPLKSGAAFVDFLGGTHLYAAVTTALFERERTGVGRSVEVSMADATYFTLTTAMGNWQLTGRTTRAGNHHPARTLAPYGVYPCADGHLALIAVNNRHWRSVLAVIGRDDLADDERYRGMSQRAEHEADVDELVAAWTAARPKAEAVAALQEAHVPAAAVRYIDDIVNDPELLDRGAIQWIDHPECGRIPVPHSPMRWHGSGLVELEPSPALGADTEAVLTGLAGLQPAEIAALVERGAAGTG